jgi:hypothetical protein
MVTSRSFFSRFADFVCLSAHAPVAWEDLRSGPKKAAHAQADSIPLNCEVNVRRSRVVCFPMDHLRALHGSYLGVHFSGKVQTGERPVHQGQQWWARQPNRYR